MAESSEGAASMAEVPAEISTRGGEPESEVGGKGSGDDSEGGGDGGGFPPSAGDSGSDSDSDEEDEAASELQVGALEQALSENPQNYNAHVEYIHLLRKLGHIKKLREARESMNVYFPLSPKMWQEWAKDETSLLTSLESFSGIEGLYERGVQEYLSVPLWSDYLEFIQEHDQSVSQCSSAGISRMRNLFERALTAAGLHIVEGKMIWEAYREYEQAIFLTMDDSDIEKKAKQVDRIRALFQRQLSVPLVDLEYTLAAYKTWAIEQDSVEDVKFVESVSSKVMSAYKKAVEMYKARLIYENQLSDKDSSERLQHFKDYIKFEESSGDPARVQVLFERSVSEYPVTSDVWLAYTGYLDRNLKVPNVLRSVYSRATRNCTWVGDLWVNYLLALERIHASEEELCAVFEKSIQCSFSSFKEYMDLFLIRIDGLRRKYSSTDYSYDLLRTTFMRASDYFDPNKVSTNDILKLHSYWSRLEANLGKDVVAARGVWEGLLKKSGAILEFWKGYITMEIEMGNTSEARALYKRCYSKKFLGSGSEDICYSWLQFEREYGTLDDYDLAVKKVTPRLQELKVFRTEQSVNSTLPANSKGGFPTKNDRNKRKLNKVSNHEQSPAKKRKDSAPEPSGVSPHVAEAAVIDNEVAGTPPNVASSGLDGRPPNPDVSKPKVFDDHCTAFVSNLSLQVTEEQLREFFSDCGGVTAIRLLKNKFTGKSRGLAYVDFLNDEHLTAAISKNKQRLFGNRLSIARSDPKQTKKGESSSSSSRGRGSIRKQSAGFPNPAKAGQLEGDTKPTAVRATFAVPRAVARTRPLGRPAQEPTTTKEAYVETLRSND